MPPVSGIQALSSVPTIRLELAEVWGVLRWGGCLETGFLALCDCKGYTGGVRFGATPLQWIYLFRGCAPSQ